MLDNGDYPTILVNIRIFSIKCSVRAALRTILKNFKCAGARAVVATHLRSTLHTFWLLLVPLETVLCRIMVKANPEYRVRSFEDIDVRSCLAHMRRGSH